jgi:hypothetical protein
MKAQAIFFPELFQLDWYSAAKLGMINNVNWETLWTRKLYENRHYIPHSRQSKNILMYSWDMRRNLKASLTSPELIYLYIISPTCSVHCSKGPNRTSANNDDFLTFLGFHLLRSSAMMMKMERRV